jgi:hypothetical protein
VNSGLSGRRASSIFLRRPARAGQLLSPGTAEVSGAPGFRLNCRSSARTTGNRLGGGAKARNGSQGRHKGGISEPLWQRKAQTAAGRAASGRARSPGGARKAAGGLAIPAGAAGQAASGRAAGTSRQPEGAPLAAFGPHANPARLRLQSQDESARLRAFPCAPAGRCPVAGPAWHPCHADCHACHACLADCHACLADCHACLAACHACLA